MLQHFSRGPVEAPQLQPEFGVGQLINLFRLAGQVRCAACRDKQPARDRKLLPTKLPAKLKCDKCAHAVPVERKWFIQQGCHRTCQRIDKGTDLREGAFGKPPAPPG